jgi:uncharacterized protein YdhG (YjbR/CyaY superfamily)
MAATKSTAQRTNVGGTSSKGFTAEEKAAMKERARELKASRDGADGESDLLAKIAEMPPSDRAMAERVHALVKANAPDLAPRTWYGMPAYARDGKVVCHFQAAAKFNSRYASFGFTDEAMVDDGAMFPVAWGLKELTPADEARIAELVKKA